MFTMYFFYNLDSKINSEKVLMQQSSGGFTNEDIGEIKSLFHGSLRRVNFYEHVIYLGEVEFENEKDYSDNINVVLNGLINQKNIQKTIYEFNNVTCVLDDEPPCNFEGDFETCENTEECEWECEMPIMKHYLFKVQHGHCEDFDILQYNEYDVFEFDEKNNTALISEYNVGSTKYKFMTNVKYIGSFESRNTFFEETKEKVLKLIKEA